MKSRFIRSMQQDKERLEKKRKSGVRVIESKKEEEGEMVQVYSNTV